MNCESIIYSKTSKALVDHYNSYPDLLPEDLFKFIFQSSFGCEHIVSDKSKVEEYITQEYTGVSKDSIPNTEPLDGHYSRVFLSWMNDGLTAKTLSKLLCMSAKKEPCGMKHLENKIQILKKLVDDGVLPFDAVVFNEKLEKWRAAGYPALHHSDVFRTKYRPSYRVIDNRYADFIRLFAQIDKLSATKSLVIAIEGGSAGGKTTLSSILEQVYGCTVFHIDDYFLRPEQRTARRLAEPGGNFDRERFFDEILKPLSQKQDVTYRRFDCSTQTLCPPVTVHPQKITVIEGAYSMHPMLAPYYDFCVFMDIDSDCQKERILKRNSPQLAQRFFNEWIPMEQRYFSAMEIKSKCSMCFEIKKDN